MVGVTDTAVSADIGGFVLSKECANKFNKSRMCTSKEVIETANPPSIPPSVAAWVQPIYGAAFRDTLDRLAVIETYTGVLGYFDPHRPMLNCGSWHSASNDKDGLVVTAKGVFGTLNCVNKARVACCAPQ
jgi:hypothetical protein